MLDGFKDFVKAKGAAQEMDIPYYCRWVANCYGYCKKKLGFTLAAGMKRDFLQHMAKGYEEWQG